jgi:hypothetical protein
MAAVGRMRGAWHQALYPLCDGFRLGGGRLQPDRAASRQLLAEMTAAIACALGTDPQTWLEMDSEEEVEAWQGAGDAPAQRLLREVGERGWAAVGTSPLRPLPPLPADVLERLLADGAAERFAALPEWESQPRETGALARSAGHPLIAAQGLRGGGRLFTRLLARLVELAGLPGRVRALLEGLEADSAPAPAEVRDGVGLAQVEAARGRLIHWVRLRSGQVADYRVVAPTEWNFHPRGGLAADLAALAADTDLPRLARLLVDAVDPCVDCRIEVTADA